jgi:hypothetical protein
MTIRAALIVAFMLVPTFLHAEVLKCKIDGSKETFFITTSPDSDGKDARIGISPGTGDRAILVPDPDGASAFVEFSADGAPLSMFRVTSDMSLTKWEHTVDYAPFAPSQKRAGKCTRCQGKKACPPI